MASISKTSDTGAVEAPQPSDFTVAPGRTVTVDGEDGPEHKGPGETVPLSAQEGRRLQRLGFLLSDEGEVTVRTDGPPTVAGVEIKEV